MFDLFTHADENKKKCYIALWINHLNFDQKFKL